MKRYRLPEIVTAYDPPPIPIRTFDWSATFEGEEELGSGRGPTEEAAVENLLTMLSDEPRRFIHDLAEGESNG